MTLEGKLGSRRENPLKRNIVKDKKKWWAAVVEGGGEAGFWFNTTKHKGRTYKYAYPFIKYGDHKDRIRATQSLFGGNVINKNFLSSSANWSVRNEEALYLADCIDEFAPSCRNVFYAYSLWEGAESTEDKL